MWKRDMYIYFQFGMFRRVQITLYMKINNLHEFDKFFVFIRNKY